VVTISDQANEQTNEQSNGTA